MIGYCRRPGCRGVGGMPKLAAGWVCSECVGASRLAMTDAPVLYLTLRSQLEPTRNQATRLSRQVTAGPPLRLDILQAAEESSAMVTEWAVIVRDRLGGGSPISLRTRFHEAAAYLLDAHASIVVTDIAPAYCGEILRWAMRVRSMTGMAQSPRRIPAPCPRCDLLGLRWFPDEAIMRCHGCGAEGDLVPDILRDTGDTVKGRR